MNTETGMVYRDDELVQALGRGEPVVEVSERVAQAVTIGLEHLNRAERRRRIAREEARHIKHA